MNSPSPWKRVTVWSGALIIAAVLLALLAAGVRPQIAAADESVIAQPRPNGEQIFISTWGSGEISQTVPPAAREATSVLTYTGSDILLYTAVYDSQREATVSHYWVKWFDGLEAGLVPYRQWKHNINAIWISPTQWTRNYDNGGPFIASFTQNQQKGIPGIDGWVDGYDLVYWNGYSFTLWFDGEDVGLNNKTQEKIDSIEVLPAPPPSSTFALENCEAYIVLSTQGPGQVPAPLIARGLPVLKFRGEDVLGFCATNLGANTTGYWEMIMDGSTLSPALSRRDVDSISASGIPTLFYGLANRAKLYHSKLFMYDLSTDTVYGPTLDFADLGITSPVDALHMSSVIRK